MSALSAAWAQLSRIPGEANRAAEIRKQFGTMRVTEGPNGAQKKEGVLGRVHGAPDILVYYYMPGNRTPVSEAVFQKDATWAAPVCVAQRTAQRPCRLHSKTKSVPLHLALQVLEEAEALLQAEHQHAIRKSSSAGRGFRVLGVRLRVRLARPGTRCSGRSPPMRRS